MALAAVTREYSDLEEWLLFAFLLVLFLSVCILACTRAYYVHYRKLPQYYHDARFEPYL
jgi:hypothetical protein